ncbi:MAG: hypothetical protein PVH61_31725 [Candidatus Aminicenantes bacterium]|jgi:hypothetical protein
MKNLKQLLRDRKGTSGILAVGAIIAVIIATAFAMIVGAIILSETYSVADGLIENSATDDANITVEGMFDIIWPSMQLLPIAILVLVGAAIMAVVALLRG